MIRFLWEVPASGHSWVEGIAGHPNADPILLKPQPALVLASRNVGNRAAQSTFRPEPNPALFRDFAQTLPEKDAILAFADRYGALDNVPDSVRPVEEMETALAELVSGTFLITWQYQINKMARLVGLLDLVQDDNRTGLAQYIRWSEETKDSLVVYFDSHPETRAGTGPALGHMRTRDVIASREENHELLAKFKIGDTFTPALVYIQNEIDLVLHHVADDVMTGMEWNSRYNRPELCIYCPTLLGAVWLQLADAVANNRSFSQCRQCGQWFEISPEAARSNRRYCSDRCRIKAYRGRQDKARQLFTLGKTFEEIAVELDSDSKTVRRWITGSRD